MLLGLVFFFVVRQLPTDGGVNVASDEIAGLLVPFVFIGFLVALYARNQIRTRRRPATNHDEYVVGPHGEVRQLGAPHSGYLQRSEDEEYPVAAAMRNLMANPQVNRPTPPTPAPARTAAARPAPPRQAAAPAPPQAVRTRPRPTPSTTRALAGSCLFSHEWQPSTLQESSLHISH